MDYGKKKIKFRIDMNEIVGFCDGECNSTKIIDKNIFDYNNPPYVPGFFIFLF
jgi:hypothetical protein